MSNGATLNSRLRVLVAKTFRAEKLYSSIRNKKQSDTISVSALSDLANEVRAKEWQNAHYQLRTALNDVLSQGGSSQQSKDLLLLREQFAKRAKEAAVAVENGVRTLNETAKRQEFAHVFKLSLELVQHKARAQASKVISEELTSLLNKAGRSTDASGLEDISSDHFGLEAVAMQESAEDVLEEELPSNVVSLLSRRAAGSRRNR